MNILTLKNSKLVYISDAFILNFKVTLDQGLSMYDLKLNHLITKKPNSKLNKCQDDNDKFQNYVMLIKITFPDVFFADNTAILVKCSFSK